MHVKCSEQEYKVRTLLIFLPNENNMSNKDRQGNQDDVSLFTYYIHERVFCLVLIILIYYVS